MLISRILIITKSRIVNRNKMANNSLHLTLIPLRFIRANELGR